MDLRSYIEHTNLSPTVTGDAIDTLVREAVEHGLFGVCVPPFWVQRARREIGTHPVKLVTVAGFPIGYQMTETRLDDLQRAIDHGADEIDVVLNLSAFKSGLPWTKIDIARCAQRAHDHQRLLKVILETAWLSDEEIARASTLCADAGADFVKTSTGFAPAGAKAEHIRIMRESIPDHVGIKASGGVKTAAQALEMIQAGATRIGTSSGVAIVLNK
ncbi:MAG: deoxyribose-phosphate aldolase [Cyclobacteriaceae bacterium]